MKATVALSVLQALVVHGIRILQGNDDGWAELYTRDFGEALRASGHDVVLSAPAEDKSVACTFFLFLPICRKPSPPPPPLRSRSASPYSNTDLFRHFVLSVTGRRP